jgi:osmotically inducible protein OsmC
MKRTGSAHWQGSGKEGKGTLATQSGVLQNTQYSYTSRFENGIGTNPEELIAAAHAGCFTMKLSFVLGAAGLTANHIMTTATITLENGAITDIHLSVTAKVPGANADSFAAAANDAKANCPVSKVLNAKITMDAKLE